MRIQSIVVYMLIVLLAAPSAMARQRQEPPEVWHAFADKLEAGAYVRVHLKNHEKVKGYFVQATDTAIRVKPKTRIPVSIRDFRFDDIESIERQREGWSPGSKVLTGVAIGVGVTLLLGVVALAASD